MPDGFVFLVLVVGLILAFAIFGFVKFVSALFRREDKGIQQQELGPRRTGPVYTLRDDVQGTSRILNFLRSRNRIDEATYRQLTGFLDDEFAEHLKLPGRPDGGQHAVRKSPAAQTTVINDQGDLDEIAVEIVKTPSPAPRTAGESAAANLPPVSLAPIDSPLGTAPTAPTSQSGPHESIPVAIPSHVAPARPAPWDIPEPPAPTPRRSFNEVMAGFMLEKNIRWGELASGILIVGSAVGLVVSLRNELRDTIPYFSALIFLLITAAIHGAGIYTLKKWKLRTTSRGTLLIGLLLIPLNFLAACILTGNEADRRALTDPLLWIALAIGLFSFGAMSWFSSKYLLRRGQLPMVVAIMGCAIGTLVINRSDHLNHSSLRMWLATLPLTFSYLVGTALFCKRQWVRSRWPERTANRLFVFLGISTFSFLVAAAMLIVRAEQNAVAVVALMPAFSVACLMTTWLGRVVWKGAAGEDRHRLSLTGLTLHILGLGLMAVALFVSVSNPTVLLLTSFIAAAGLMLFAWQQQEARLLPAAWAAFAALVVCTVNLYVGKLGWDSWANGKQLLNALVNGQSGLSLLAAGAGVAGFHTLYGNRTQDQSKFMRVGWFSGAAMLLVGCALALIASLVNRYNMFDTMTATSLLGIAAVMSLAVCVRVAGDDKTATGVHQNLVRYLPHVAAALTLGFFAHAFGWNPWLRDWLDQTTFGIGANWDLIFAVTSIVLAVFAVACRFRSSGGPTSTEYGGSVIAELLGDWSGSTNAIGLVGLLFLLRYQTGLATGVGILLSIGWLLLTWAQANHRFGVRFWTSLFTAATGYAVVVFVAELLTRTQWCPGIEMPRHWLIQCLALSIWAAVWLVFCWVLRRGKSVRKFVDFQPRVEWAAVHVLVLVMASMIGVALLFGTISELFRDAGENVFTLAGDRAWTYAALGGIGLAVFLAVFQRPTRITGVAIVVTWLVGWSFGADSFIDSKSVGSALRWLLPIGGAVGAAMVAARRPFRPAWAAARNRLDLGGKSTWPSRTTQALIDFALAIVTLVVLSISTVAITQVLMRGGAAALGGPVSGSWFGDLRKDVSYGIPVGIIVGTFLLYAISEKRKWLATAGSAVFQYCVVLAVMLLFISPHPQLATEWFVNILQSVSVGMTAYGFVWLYYRERIEGEHAAVASQSTPLMRLPQIEVHTLINGLLITSLAVLVIVRFYSVPDQYGGWISTVGGWLGIVAWATYGALAFFVWREKLAQPHRTSTWMWLACWSGMVLVAMIAALVDRRYAAAENSVPWLTFNLIMWGAVVVCFSQVVLLWLERRPEWLPGVHSLPGSQRFTSIRGDQTLPLLFAGAMVTAFAVRGIYWNPGSAWYYLAAIGLLIGCLVVAGMLRQSAIIGFIAAALTTLGAIVLVDVDPSRWFTGNQPYLANVLSMAVALLALVWSGFYVYRRLIKTEQVRPSFVWMSNLVLLLSSIWVLLGGLLQWIYEAGGGGPTASSLNNVCGAGAIVGPILLAILHTWNDRRRFQVLSHVVWLVGVVVFALSVLITIEGMRGASILMGLGLVVTVGGSLWANRARHFAALKQMGAPALISLERSMYRQLPILGLILGAIVLSWAFIASQFVEPRAERYLCAMSPFAVAVGMGLLSDQKQRRWLQLVTLGLVTVGAIYVAWADLSPVEIRQQPMRLFVRALLVLAGAMFVYGGLVSRWVREGDTWLKSLREMAVSTCFLALPCLAIVIWLEMVRFQPDIGCGMPIAEAIAVTTVVLGMIAGLITIAVLPRSDPFSMSLKGRMAYVYVAQVVVAMLAVHLYTTMPWLFEFGIKEYWPYIAMALCFGGVGIAGMLEKRNLAVLGKPLFNTAAVLPVIVAAGIWAIDSKADSSLVMLTVGLVYLMISYTQKSILSGAASIVFGNLALWLFYYNRAGFTFVDHPQLWLIPPALSTLVAAQISKDSFSRQQLGLIRYVCVTIIYLSSTSEIFISGFGERLWPPMVLATLAIAGMFAGIMLHIRAYLYLGFVFLLMAMVSMVSHAHQRFEHVWPWWAFGIGMGVAILVMFGLFEKRKNDLQAIVGQLREWDL